MDLYRAILLTGLAAHVTLRDFYKALCAKKCGL